MARKRTAGGRPVGRHKGAITRAGIQTGRNLADPRDMPGAPQPAPAPLTPDQLRALADASRQARKVRRCAAVATFGGWTAGSFGVLTLLTIPFSFSLSGLFIGIALVVAAAGEFHGAALIRRLDPRGPHRLALNQLGLGASLVVYSLWCLAAGLLAAAPSSVASGDAHVDAMVAGITRSVTIAVYGTFAIIGVVGPGLTAWYYASRAPALRRFTAATDPTIVEALKAA